LYYGQLAGSFGDLSCFSCYPTKNLGALGDAGLVLTSSAHLASRLRMLRQYGWGNNRINSLIPGKNSRLDEIQAAVLKIKLEHLEQNIVRRNNIAMAYSRLLSDSVAIPAVRPNTRHAFHLYVCQHPKRDQLINKLLACGIQCGIHYKLPVHLQSSYINKAKRIGDLSVTTSLCDRAISLPIFPQMTDDQVNYVIDKLIECDKSL